MDDQLNASACHMLRKAVIPEYKDSIALLKTAKEIWDTLQDIFEGDDSVQRSRLAMLKQDINLFIKKDGETVDQVYQRLKSIVLDLRNFGCTWANDDFIKDKFMGAMILTDSTMVTMIFERPDYEKLTPNQIVSSFTNQTLLVAKSHKPTILFKG